MMVIICKLAPGLKSIGKVETAALCPSENGCSPEPWDIARIYFTHIHNCQGANQIKAKLILIS